MKRCQHECRYNERKIKFSINLKITTKGNVLYTLLCGVNSNENKKNFNTNRFNRMALDTIQTRRRWIYLVIFRCNNLLMTHNGWVYEKVCL